MCELCKEHPMAEERDHTHDPVSGQGAHAADLGMAAAAATPGSVSGYPGSEADYWRSTYSSEPYYEDGRAFDEYGPAYELGWTSYGVYGGEFDAADPVLANDWEVRPGNSKLSWDQARPG